MHVRQRLQRFVQDHPHTYPVIAGWASGAVLMFGWHLPIIVGANTETEFVFLASIVLSAIFLYIGINDLNTQLEDER